MYSKPVMIGYSFLFLLLHVPCKGVVVKPRTNCLLTRLKNVSHLYWSPLCWLDGQLILQIGKNFIGVGVLFCRWQNECDKCQTLHDAMSFTVHTTFSDFDPISRSQQCWTVVAENLMSYLIKLKNKFGSLSKSGHCFSLLHIFKGDNWCVFWFDKNFYHWLFGGHCLMEVFQNFIWS